MIIYGLTLQDKPQEVPEEVATWLLEQQARYPLIDFQINYSNYSDAEIDDGRRKYSRSWNGKPNEGFGPKGISFHFLRESWHINVVGGRDASGDIADLSIPPDSTDPRRSVAPLGARLRAEITTMPPLDKMEPLGEEGFGLLRTAPAEERPLTMVSFPPDIFMTSELSMSGAEFADLLHGEPTERKTQIVEAVSAKDWEQARTLLKQRH